VVGELINAAIVRKYIDVSDIEKEIEKTISQITAAQVLNLTPDNTRILSIEPTGNRLTLKKKIDSSFNIVYDFDLELQYI